MPLRSKLTFPCSAYWTLVLKSLRSRLSRFLQSVKIPGDASRNQAPSRCRVPIHFPLSMYFYFLPACYVMENCLAGGHFLLVQSTIPGKARLEKPDVNAERWWELCILGYSSIWEGFPHFPASVGWWPPALHRGGGFGHRLSGGGGASLELLLGFCVNAKCYFWLTECFLWSRKEGKTLC